MNVAMIRYAGYIHVHNYIVNVRYENRGSYISAPVFLNLLKDLPPFDDYNIFISVFVPDQIFEHFSD